MNQIDIQSPDWLAFNQERSSNYMESLFSNDAFDYDSESDRIAAAYGWTSEQVADADDRECEAFYADLADQNYTEVRTDVHMDDDSEPDVA